MLTLRTLPGLALLLLCLALPAASRDLDALVLIGHAGLTSIDRVTAQRLYTGRAVEVGGVPATVVNAPPGSGVRQRFMAEVMEQDDDHYVAYWTVRKHIGKGTPPRELPSAAAVMDFVQATPGGIGYVLASELRPGIHVLLRP